MKLHRSIFAVLIAISAGKLASAQLQEDWVPQGVEALRQGASSKIEFNLDHTMLVFASRLDQNDDDLRRVIAGVSGLSVHCYRFPEAWMYDPGVLDSLKKEYHRAGWEQLVNNHDKAGSPGVTDLWIRLENKAISNVAVLVARSKQVDLIEVSGSISPLDLLHLCGHFGIPRIEAGVAIPNAVPNNEPRP